MKIIDCFIYYNENDLLNYRLSILNNVVDYFIIVESTHTFTGKEKIIHSTENAELLEQIKEKIIHIIVDDFPHKYPNINFEKKEQWNNEIYQRNCIKRGLETLQLNDDDIIIISDLDEIPDPNTLTKIKNNEIVINIHKLEQDCYYYNLNTKFINKWTNAKILSYKKYIDLSISCNDIRFYNCSTIQNGGWHLSYFGNSQYIKNKLENFSHQEYNNNNFIDTNKIEERINNYADLFDRPFENKNIIKLSIANNSYLPYEYYKYLQKFIRVKLDDYKTLTRIGLKYGTDKSYFHLFTEYYNDYFEKFLNKSINILEIGILQGKSILMLNEFFPNSTIYAIDINKESVNLDLGININKYLCSQDDFVKMKSLFNNIKFDIIIEDGSHMTHHQQTSLGFLFPYLNKNGIYICEDLHTSYVKEYINTNKTTIEIIKEYNQTKKIVCDVIDDIQLDYLNSNIEYIKLYERNQNALMCYNCKTHNYNNLNNCNVCNINLSPSEKSITSIFKHK